MARKLFLVPEIIPPSAKSREGARQDVRPFVDKMFADSSAEDREWRAENLLAHSAFTDEAGLLLALPGVLEDEGNVTRVVTPGFDQQRRAFTLDPAGTLEEFWALVSDFRAGEDLIIGHDLLGHGLPFLCRVSALLRVRATIDLCWRYEGANPLVFDTLRAWTYGNAQRLTLEELGFLLNQRDSLGAPSGTPPVRLSADESKHAEVLDGSLRKVSKLYGIYYRMTCGDARELYVEEVIDQWRGREIKASEKQDTLLRAVSDNQN